MYSYHVLLLPVAMVALVVAHVLLVRRHGVVPPFALEDRAASSGAASAEREPAFAVVEPPAPADGAPS
jgi:ubiquinol-cytochrome c reductase cytochrome b subunit